LNRRKNGWTEEQDDALVKFWMTDLPAAEFAVAHRKALGAVYQRAYRKRLPRKSHPTRK
jgi:hypothetical protein